MRSQYVNTIYPQPICAVLFILLLGVTPQSIATVYEIFPTGMTANCNEELENMANALQPGDELILHDGIYAQGCARKFTINGTAEQPIIIRAADGASPLVTRPEETGATSNNLELAGSYYTIRGLRFQYGSAGVRFMASHHITFEDNEIFDTLNNALNMNSGNTDSHIIRNNHIHHTGLADGDTEGEGMYLGSHTGSKIATNHLIENNHIHHLRSTNGGGNDGIEIKFGSGGNIVRGNLIHDTTIGVSFPCIFAYGHGPAPNIIENNTLYNCGEAILVTADAIVRNNVILDSSFSGIHLNRQNPAPNIQNVSIVNNTVFGSHPECASLKVGSAPNIVIANNAFYCEGSTAVSGHGFANASVFNNYVSGHMSGASVDDAAFFAGGASSDAFVDSAARDFQLKSASILVDAGLNSVSDTGTTDHAGSARFSGGSIDVGAFEYDSQASPVPPTLDFSAPATVVSGNAATLSWTTANASDCTASGDWSGSKSINGSETTPPITAHSTYTLTCNGTGGSVEQSLTIEITPPSNDSDNDGLPDTWETEHFGNLQQSGSDDPDNDTVSNTLELSNQTDPQSSDTDSDGLSDGEEITHSTDPLKVDTDNDGHNDLVEVQAGSDPNNADDQPLIEIPVVPPVVPPDTGGSGSGALGPWSLLLFFLWRKNLARAEKSQL